MTTRTIVVGADGSEGSEAAIRWCAEHARALDAHVVAVHAIPPLANMVPPGILTPARFPDDTEFRRELATALDAWCEPLDAARVDFEPRLVDGPAAATLMHFAADEGADLLVVGRRGQGGFAELLLGSVPHTLSHHCAVPLVIVPTS